MRDSAKDEKALFLAALEQAGVQEREAFLRGACGGDGELLKRVKVLLSVHEDSQGPLDAPSPGVGTAPTADEPITERPGTVIGPYKLLEQIGEGGFGVVFMAEQQQPVRRKVALKVLKPGMDSRQVIARFESERQALAIMDHPNIAKVHDGGETQTGRPYFVMELVNGISLTEYCDQNQLTPRERLELFIPVCQAVQHAHQKGIIHRDLKPSNILVTLHDGVPMVKVIDFGIAKALGQQLTDKTLFTGFAQMVGTPLYMSPEQAALSNVDVDTRSDIYALGVLLYELLTGTTPFDKVRFKAAGFDEIRRIIREEEPPKPSTRITTLGQAATTRSAQRRSDPKRLRQLCRGELDWIVMKALDKDRNRRYQTTLELAADLQRHLRHEPVLACPPRLAYLLGKFVRRHRGPAAAIAAVLVVLVGGIGATTLAYLQARAAERKAREAEAEARATADFLTFDMLALAPEGGAGDQKVTISEALDVAVPEVDRALGPQPRVEAAVRHVMGTVYQFMGEPEKARPHLERAIALRRRELGEDDPSTLNSQHNLCTVLQVQGQLPEAETLARHVLDARRRKLLPRDTHIASSCALLGRILTDEGKPERAEPLLREALDTFGTALPEGHWRTVNVQSLLGDCLIAQGRYAEAEPLLLAACQALQSTSGSPRHHTRRAFEHIVQLYEAWGKKDKADEWRRKLQRFAAPEKAGTK